MKASNKHLLRRLLIAPTVLLAGAAFSAEAAIVVDFDQSKPTSDIIVSYDPAGGTPSAYAWLYQPNYKRLLGESFAIPGEAGESYQLERITMKLKADAVTFTQKSAFTITIYEIAKVTSPPLSDVVVSTQHGTMQPTKTTAPAGYFTFNLDTPVLLEAGKVYSYVLEFDEEGSAQSLNLEYNGVSSSGKAWQSQNDGAWSSLGFTYVYYLEGTKMIPEAGTAPLVGSFLLLAGLIKGWRTARERMA